MYVVGEQAVMIDEEKKKAAAKTRVFLLCRSLIKFLKNRFARII